MKNKYSLKNIISGSDLINTQGQQSNNRYSLENVIGELPEVSKSYTATEYQHYLTQTSEGRAKLAAMRRSVAIDSVDTKTKNHSINTGNKWIDKILNFVANTSKSKTTSEAKTSQGKLHGLENLQASQKSHKNSENELSLSEKLAAANAVDKLKKGQTANQLSLKEAMALSNSGAEKIGNAYVNNGVKIAATPKFIDTGNFYTRAKENDNKQLQLIAADAVFDENFWELAKRGASIKANGKSISSFIVDENTHNIINGYVKSSGNLYNYLTDDEKLVYNAYIGVGDYATAHKFLTLLQPTLNARKANAISDSINEYEDKGIIQQLLGGAAKLGISVGTGLKSGLDDMASAAVIINRTAGIGTPIDYKILTPTFSEMLASEIISNEGKSDSWLFNKVLQAINSTARQAPALAMGAVGGSGAYIITLSTQIIGGDGRELIPQGYSALQSTIYGLVDSALEIGMDYLIGGVSTWFDNGIQIKGVRKSILDGLDNVLKDHSFLRNVAKTFVAMEKAGNSEGVEEFLQRLIEPITRNIILGESNQYSSKDLTEAFEAYFVGALSGMLMGIGTGNLSVNDQQMLLEAVGNAIKEQGAVKGIVNLAKNYKITSDNYNQVKKNVNTPERVSDETIGRLYYEIYGEMIDGAQDITAVQNLIATISENGDITQITNDIFNGDRQTAEAFLEFAKAAKQTAVEQDVLSNGAVQGMENNSQQVVDNAQETAYTGNERGASYGGEELLYNGRRQAGEQNADTQGRAGTVQEAAGGMEGDLSARRFGNGALGDRADTGRVKLTPAQAERLQTTAIQNDDGTPKAVYHFTPNMEFDTFGEGDTGFHFGSADQAAQRGRSKGQPGRVITAYLDIQNPVRVNADIMNWQPDALALKLYGEGVISQEEMHNVFGLARKNGLGYNSSAAVELRRILAEKGYDGVVYPNGFEGDGDSYIAFYPEQVIILDDGHGRRDVDPGTDEQVNRDSASNGADSDGSAFYLRDIGVQKPMAQEVSAVSDVTLKPKEQAEIREIINRLSSGEHISADEIEKIPAIAAAIEKASQIPETYTIDTPARQELRDKIVRELLNNGSYSGVDANGKDVYNGNIRKDRRIDIVIGPPAAGKSSVLVHPLSQQNQARVIDSDMAKELLPEFNNGIGANAVHQESKNILKHLIAKSIANGDNIVYPIVGGRDVHKLVGTIQSFKNSGYSVYLHLNDLEIHKALGRALNRFLETGRFIPPQVILSYADNPKRNFEKIIAMEGLLDGYTHYSNDVGRGEDPILITEENGAVQLLHGTGRLGYGGNHTRGEYTPEGIRSQRSQARGRTQAKREQVNRDSASNGADSDGSAFLMPENASAPQDTRSVFTEPDVRKSTDYLKTAFDRINGFTSLTSAQREVYRIGRDLGRQVVFEDTLKTRGFQSNGYIDGYGVIHIDYGTADPVRFVFKLELMYFAEGTEAYAQFVEAVESSHAFREWLSGKTGMQGESVTRMEAAYRQAVIESRRDKAPIGVKEAQVEMIADFAGDTLFAADGDLNRLVASVAARQRSSFVDYIRNFFTYTKERLQKRKGISGEIVKLERRFREAVAAATEQNPTADNGRVRYSLKQYTNKQLENWADSKNIVVYENQAQFEQFVDEAANNKQFTKKIYFGAITHETAQLIKNKTGISVEGFNCSLGANEIRKVLKDHGAVGTEKPRGQKAIGKKDILNILSVLQDFDNVRKSETNYDGKPVLLFEKNLNGKMTVVAVVSNKHLDLRVQTAYQSIKNGNLAIPPGENNLLLQTSKTPNGTVSINSIHQKDSTVNIQSMLKGKKYSIPAEAQALLDRYDNGEISRDAYHAELAKLWNELEPGGNRSTALESPAGRKADIQAQNDLLGLDKMTRAEDNKGVLYKRPSKFRKGVRNLVWENAKDERGLVIDPVTQKEIRPGDSWDMGHKPGYEFRKHKKSAQERGITRKEFLDEHNNPNHYRPELPGSNRSHADEIEDSIYFGP